MFNSSTVEFDKKMFSPGQLAFFLDQEGRAHGCVVDKYQNHEILVSKDGRGFGWFTDDTLFHSTDEAYAQCGSQ